MVSILRSSKKADVILDSVLFVIVIVIFAIAAISIYPAVQDINKDIQADDDFNAQSKGIVNNLEDKFPSWVDGVFILIIVLITIVLIVSALFIDTSPWFFVAAVILFIIVLLLAGYLSNANEELLSDIALGNVQNTFPITFWILTHLIHIFIIEFILLGITLYGKSRLE